MRRMCIHSIVEKASKEELSVGPELAVELEDVVVSVEYPKQKIKIGTSLLEAIQA